MDIVLTTERLNLRKMTTDDVDRLMKIFSDPEAMTYYPSTLDEAGTLEWIHRVLGNYQKFGVGLWIVEDKATGRFLGQCGIIPQELDGIIEMEIGYLLVRQEWGQGYASESARACKEYGFETMGYRKMISLIDINNIRSAKVAERIGMRVEQQIVRCNKNVWVYSAVKQREA